MSLCPGPIHTCVFAPGRLSGPGLRCHGGASFLNPSRPAKACLGVSLSSHKVVPRGGPSEIVQWVSESYPSLCRIRDIMCAVTLRRRAADPGLVRQTDSAKGLAVRLPLNASSKATPPFRRGG